MFPGRSISASVGVSTESVYADFYYLTSPVSWWQSLKTDFSENSYQWVPDLCG